MALWVKLAENVSHVVNNAADKGYCLSKTYCAVCGADGCQPCHLTLSSILFINETTTNFSTDSALTFAYNGSSNVQIN